MTKPQQQSSKAGFLSRLTGQAALEHEKERLSAFLDAVPAAYCGWAPDGSVQYNPEFPALLGIQDVHGLVDVQDALSPSDAAVLESLFENLKNENLGFSVAVKTADSSRTLRLSGSAGQSSNATYHVLWLEDVTVTENERQRLEDSIDANVQERNKLQVALDFMPLPLWMRNSHTEIIWCNKAYAQVLETSPATVIAEQRELPAKLMRKGNNVAPGKEQAQKALNEGQAQETVAHTILGGSRRLLSIAEIPFPALNITLGVARDITREEELETEQKRYMAANKELLEQLGTAIGIFNADQRLEFYNSAFAQQWGLEEKYLNTKPTLSDLMEKLRETRRLPEQADFKKFKQTWLNMFTGLLEPYDEMLYLPDSSALRMLVVPHPMGGLMMTFEDVSSRLELESSYNTLIAVQKETLDNLSEGVVVFGGDGRVKLWNPAFARLWNLNPEDLEGDLHVSQLTDRVKKNFAEEDWPESQKALVAQCIERTAKEGYLEPEDRRQIFYSTMPLPDGGVLVTHVDVTDTIQVEKALREKNAALEAAEQLKTDFLANVSYQLRTPLNAIMGFTEILNNEYFGPLNDRQREYTESMHDAGARLLNLIDDILDLSTIEAGYMTLESDNVSIKDILENIYDLTEDWARKEKIKITLKCPKTVGQAVVDATRMRQVFLNLVRNAISYTPSGGEITISAKRMDGVITMSVKDTGAGIPEEEQGRIFEPFERIAGTRQRGSSKDRGAGLGLTLVKNIVELHGGRIMLESTLGKGSTFIVTLPVDDEAPKTGK